MTDPSLAEELEDIRAKRGYLLPHHGLMAISMPEVLEAYDALYSRLTLSDRVLSTHEHEFVWLAVLIATHEALATHHIPRYLDAGGSLEEFSRIATLTALAKGSDGYEFVNAHWLPHVQGFDAGQAFITAYEEAAGPIPLDLAHMAGAAVHLCTGRWESFAWQLKAAYVREVDEHGLAEALSLAMFPGSVPHFVEAAAVWQRLIAAGSVTASAAFKTWATLTGQGGFDQAAGIRPDSSDPGNES